MRTIKCKYCGKSYASPSEMQKRKCHSHPNGAWGGFCTPNRLDKLLWEQEAHREEIREDIRQLDELKEKSESFKREYKMQTPLITWGRWSHSEPSDYDLEIRNSDLHAFVVELGHGIKEKTRDAINTVYALRAGCDYVLNNADAQKEGSLSTWLDEVRQLKDEVADWDFWAALYWLTKQIKDDVLGTSAGRFHRSRVLPMLQVLSRRKDVDEKDKEVMKEVTTYVAKLKSEYAGRAPFGTLSKWINDYSFWGVLYCLYWIKLRPTPWDGQKVWPIPETQNDAEVQDTPAKHQVTQSDKNSGSDKQPSEQEGDSNPLEELETLIGLGTVKDEVQKLVELVKFNASRKAKGLPSGGMTSHFVFTGNPGTGKTTVARIVANIYRQLGILKKGHLVEVDRSKIVAGYVGHTAIQTNEVVDSAMDGVLFIDEAYSLVAGGSSDFGSEAIATLLKRMEDARERIVVIAAGYANEMSRFVKSNPGLESRFTKFIDFPDYTVDELVSIFDSIVKKNQFTCSSKGQELARKTIEAAAVNGHVSGNARYVRNLFNAVRERMARRVMKIENASMIQLQTIEAEDFLEQVDGTLQQSMPPSTIMNVNSESEQLTAAEEFNMSQYLKALRGTTLGLKDIWSEEGKHGWETTLPNGTYLACWQGAVKTQLIFAIWVGCSTWKDSQGDFITEPHCKITNDGKSCQLEIFGNFLGNWPIEDYNGIDFSSDSIQSDLMAAEDAFCAAWQPLGIDTKVGDQIDHWNGGIDWCVTIPFKGYDELVSDKFSQKLRSAFAATADAFAPLLKYRVSVNS